MALSKRTKDIMIVALADKKSATELASAVDAGGNPQAAHVANATAATAITIALSTTDTYTDSAVNTAVNTALITAVTDINALEVKINAILAALQAAGLML